MKKVLSIILLVVSFAMIGTGVYLMNSSKYIFTTTVDKALSYVVNDIYDTKYVFDDIDLSKNFKVSSNTALKVSNENLANLDMNVLHQGSEYYLDANTKFMDKDFIGAELYAKDKDVYLTIKEALTDYYHFNLDDYIESYGDFDITDLPSVSKEEAQLLVKHLKKAISDAVTEKDFVKSNENIMVNNNQIKAIKVQLNLKSSIMKKIAEKCLTNISSDQNAIKIIQKFLPNITKESIDSTIEALKNIKLEEEENFVCLSLYLNGSYSLVKVELTSNDLENDDTKIGCDWYNKYQNYELYFTTRGNRISYKSETISKDTNNIEFLGVDEDGKERFKVTGQITSNINLYSIELNMNVEEVSFQIKEVFSKNSVSEYQNDLSVTVSYSGTNMVLSSNSTLVFADQNIEVDVSSAKEMDEFTEEESEELTNYIEDKLAELIDSLGEEDLLPEGVI